MLEQINFYGDSIGEKFTNFIENNTSNDFNFTNDNNSGKKRSSSGCLTCKIRKKRCDEVKPICGDCMRLGRRCAYITENMTEDEIKKLKEEMLAVEKDSKSRKRRKKNMFDDEHNNDDNNNISNETKDGQKENRENKTSSNGANKPESTIDTKSKFKVKSKRHKSSRKKSNNSNKVVFNPLAISMPPLANSSVFQGVPLKTSSSNATMPNFISMVPTQIQGHPSLVQLKNSNDENSIGVSPSKSANYSSIRPTIRKQNDFSFHTQSVEVNNYQHQFQHQKGPQHRYEQQNGHQHQHQSQHQSQHQLQHENEQAHQHQHQHQQHHQEPPLLSPSFFLNFSTTPNPNDIPINFTNDLVNSNTPTFSLNGEENAVNFSNLFSTGFSKVLQDHFKTESFDLNNFTSGDLNNQQNYNNTNIYSNENNSNINSINTNNNNNSNSNLNSLKSNRTSNVLQIQDMFKFSPHFQEAEISRSNSNQLVNLDEESYLMYNKIEEITDYEKEDNVNNGSGNINNNNNIDANFEKIEQLVKFNQQQKQPHIYMNPSIVRSSTLENLTPLGMRLYEYYRDKLSFIVCSAPKAENMYLNTFLPMAHIDKSVLYGILAWSAFHLGGPAMEKQGNYYIKLALEGFYKRPILNEESVGKSKLICDDVDDNDDEIIKEPDIDVNEDNENLQISSLNKDNMINMRLAAFLILCGVEICRGDVSKWSTYLTYGAKLIKLKGGLEKFNESKDEHFLVTNFAYHDITAIQVINERTIHFDVQEYEKMWSKSQELGFTDPLHGVSSPIFKILAEINKLVITVQKLVKRSKKDDLNELNKISKTNISESPLLDEKVYGLDEEDYWITDELSSAASSIDEMFLNGVPSTVSDEWPDADFDKDVNLEDLDKVMIECQQIEERIAHVKPNLSPYVTNKELELQLTMFECFQVTAKIHLRQSVLRMNSSSIEIQYLTNQLVKLLDVLLGSEVEACLCFPMFIAGMNCVTRKDRINMTKRFESFIKRYKWKNVLRCQIVTRYIWKLNCKGEKFVDWYAVVKTLGWDLSFA